MRKINIAGITKLSFLFVGIAIAGSIIRNEIIIRNISDDMQASVRIGASVTSMTTIFVTLILILAVFFFNWHLTQLQCLKINHRDFVNSVVPFLILLTLNELLKIYCLYLIFTEEVARFNGTFSEEELISTDYYRISTYLDYFFILLGILFIAERLYTKYNYTLKTSLTVFVNLCLTIVLVWFLFTI